MRLFTQAQNPGQFLSHVADNVGRTVHRGGDAVMGSLQRAASATGVNFDYLLRTAQRESSLNPKAKAPTSSAAGLFQFIEQTWLGTMKSAGAKHGYGAYADQITRGRDGRYHVTNSAARRDILNLRYNADAAAVMGAELTAGHAAYLKGRIGRDVTQGELYAAHFLGPEGAANLITAAQNRPGASAAALFPAAARANPTIFYSHGRSRTVTEVMANLTKTGGNAPMPIGDPAPQMDTERVTIARWDKVQSDQAIINLVFGGQDGQSGMLFNTQLMSAFGPGDEEKRDRRDGVDSYEQGLGKAFGLGDNSMG
ncbi:transglycosylase SLT domain protein [Asticcacaulis biprosthecium C19]|uniref:Transglycosylase SLT domain protein n=1 Tax=Asticcacaulis biprosthecium C19 TaxID=715226 RepID=F4QS05_9CAUL|nr:transglycosylase SLT domain-containing protein [Asticcacaulis biprosthecium]EGF89525.1 transglycosylase SLT domain protein [Asticcacaulis biprosthecium C19]